MTSGLAVLSVMGPESRALLSRVTGADLSNEAFPFGTAQQIEIGYAPLRALRVTYVGELGWELYVPSEFACGVFDTIMTAGEEDRIRRKAAYEAEHVREIYEEMVLNKPKSQVVQIGNAPVRAPDDVPVSGD